MNEWRDLLSGPTSIVGVFGFLLGVALLVALRVLLQEETRPRLKAPFVLLVVYVVAGILRSVAPSGLGVRKTLEVTGLFCLLSALGHLGFAFVADWFLAQRLGRPLPRIFHDILQALVFVGVGLVTLRAMGVEPGSILTTSALLTAVIGLSLQETLGNLFAGLAVQTERPFDVGDYIQFEEGEDLIGRVAEINWRSTKIVTSDLVQVIVPNSTLAKAPLKNFSRPTPMCRRRVVVQSPYDVPPGRAIRALLEAVKGSLGVLAAPEPRALLHSYADSGIEYRVQYFISDFEHRLEIDSTVRERIWHAFARAGISIPFPIREVLHHDVAAEARESPPDVASQLRALRGAEFFDALPRDALEALAQVAKIRTYSAGELVVRQGDTGTELFLVKRGEVVVMLEREGAAHHQLARLGPGRVFGEVALMTGERRTATIEALRETTLLVIDEADFREVMQRSPELKLRISELLSERQAQLASIAPGPGAPADEALSRALLNRLREFFSR